MTRTIEGRVSSSFRDPTGFVFVRDGELFRQVNHEGAADYRKLLDSGLYQDLVRRGWLIPHQEVDVRPEIPAKAHRVIRPEPVPFISYPYEWCFSQWKESALLTLNIEALALDHGMSLKDASAFNVQFRGCRPTLIDTLSFERYREGEPWPAYGQFCRHFLAPLALMARRDVRLGRMLVSHVDGIPLDLACTLLPAGTWLMPGLALHLHAHARSRPRQHSVSGGKSRSISRMARMGIIRSLSSAVRRLRWSPGKSTWSHYYGETNYSAEAMARKDSLVAEFLGRTDQREAWDLGANTGRFSRVALAQGMSVVAFDADPIAVEFNYLQARKDAEDRLLPLVMDLCNPSPAIGWAGTERMAWFQRGPAAVVMALALIHHLAIGNNLPLEDIAAFLAGICRFLIIEFVPKSDSQVQRMLAVRQDIFERYRIEEFEKVFRDRFEILETAPIEGSERTLYLMRNRSVSGER